MNKPNIEHFNVKENQVLGETMYLVTPKLQGVPWDKENLIFRSSLWNKSWNPVSLGFKKFFNWGEESQLVPEPADLNGAVAVEKLDGSLLIVSRYKGQLIMRTRGTVDARQMENGHEIDLFIKKYPKAFDNDFLVNNVSLLFEWTSPENIIILDYGKEPDIKLVGAVCHFDYSYLNQNALDVIAMGIGMERPKYMKFQTIDEMIQSVQGWNDQEGVCLYYNKGQDIKKIKSLDYLKRHAFKSMCSPKNILNLWLDFGKPELKEFKEKIINDFDYECWTMAEYNSGVIIQLYEDFMAKKQAIEKFVQPLKNVSRKEAAQKIIAEFSGLFPGVSFTLLDGKQVEDKVIKKFIEQQLKETDQWETEE